MPGVVVYKCPDGKNYSLYSDRRDCPRVSAIDGGNLGGSGSTRVASRFLGSRTKTVSQEELASVYHLATPEPEPLNRKKLVVLGIAGFSLVLLLLLLARRKRK